MSKKKLGLLGQELCPSNPYDNWFEAFLKETIVSTFALLLSTLS